MLATCGGRLDRNRLVVIVLALATLSASAFAESRPEEGALDGVAYRIAKPGNWNGGLTLFTFERKPEIFRGALLECGVVDGITLFDWRYAYAAAAGYLSYLPSSTRRRTSSRP